MHESAIAVVEVSPEMVTIVGSGDLADVAVPDRSLVLLLSLEGRPSLRIAGSSERSGWRGEVSPGRSVSLIVMRSALRRLFNWSPASFEHDSFYLSHDLASIAERLLDDHHGREATTAYRLGKSIELLCDIMAALGRNELIPMRPDGSLSTSDGKRLADARRMIDEQWTQKLTLDQIARCCGLNRSKLSRGFREIYRCSVSEALAERRLAEARRQLLSTDLPVSTVGYRSGYSNNASFSRAFGRRFGMSPSDLRSGGAAL